MPACRKQWGLELPMPPCQAFAPEVWDYRDFPPSCECLAECQAANVRVVYVTWCVNASQHRYSASMEGWPPRVVGQGVTHPWRDPFGDGRWLRQAYTPNRHQQPLTEQQLSQLNLELAARLEADGKASAAAKACSGYGLLTAPMPWYSWRQHNGKVCHCFPGWFGEQCEFGPGRPQAPAEKQYCVHGCSGRGVCKLNYCHCAPGTWGVDCGFGEPDAFLAEATKARQLYLGLAAPHGWTDQMLATPKPRPPAQGFGNARHLKIYVYDVPPQYHVWMAAHFRRSGRWDQSYLYSLDAKLHRWLLHSPYRTLDPNAADYFFIPCYLSLGFYDFEFGLYWMSNRGHVFLKGVLNYISQTFPYYNRSKGSDHILVMTNDKGATFIRGSVPQLQHVNLITQWGWVRPHIHHPESDIVVPPMLKVDKLIAESPFMGALDSTHGAAYAAASSTGYKYLLSFVGSVRFHTPGYSMGVRQKVFRLYNQTERFFLADLRGDSIMGKHKALPPKKYLEILQASKFCLAPSGMGFSTRTYEAMAQGCVPLIIQDEPVSNTTVDQAFASLLPWNEFSLRLKQADIPRLPEILSQYPDAEWRRLRRNLACAWPRILWLQADNEAPGMQTASESARADATAKLGQQGYLSGYDAFESVMHTLARRAAARKKLSLPEFQWRTPAQSCKTIQGEVAAEPPQSATRGTQRR